VFAFYFAKTVRESKPDVGDRREENLPVAGF